MTSTAVKTLLLDNIVTVLTASLITNIPTDDDTRVGQIVIGRYRSSMAKVTGGMSVEVHGNHLLGPTRTEAGKDTPGDTSFSSSWDLPLETIGGSIYRWMRGVVVLQYEFKTKTRDEADTITEVVAARIRAALYDNSAFIGIEDTFGSLIHAVEVADNFQYTNEGYKPATGRLFVEFRAMTTRKRSR